MIQIELNEEDAELFVLFRKHQDEFKRLLSEGLFQPYNGSVTVHKDGKRIRKIALTIIVNN